MKQVFFVPDRGDIVWVSVGTRAGQKQTGRRLALVLSPQAYNVRAGLALLCPLTNRVKGYPFEVPLPPDLPVEGAVLADQALSLDWRAHRAERVCSLPSALVDETLGKLRTLLDFQGACLRRTGR
jgi:mRNA interferase MazF